MNSHHTFETWSVAFGNTDSTFASRILDYKSGYVDINLLVSRFEVGLRKSYSEPCEPTIGQMIVWRMSEGVIPESWAKATAA